MVTKFDIGDVIRFEVVAKVKSYEVSEDGDCWVVSLIGSDGTCNEQMKLYLETEDLELCHAVKIDLNENKNNETRKEQTW